MADAGLGPSKRRLFRRWLGLPRFVRNTLVSLPTFLVDISLLLVLVRLLSVNYLIAGLVSFLAATVLSYFLARRMVFRESRRGMRAGFVAFLAVAAASALLLAPAMGLLVGVFHLDLVVARVIATIAVSVGAYLANRLLIFGGRRQPPPDLPEPAESRSPAAAPQGA
jgi:putative flippase GtrA